MVNILGQYYLLGGGGITRPIYQKLVDNYFYGENGKQMPFKIPLFIIKKEQ